MSLIDRVAQKFSDGDAKPSLVGHAANGAQPVAPQARGIPSHRQNGQIKKPVEKGAHSQEFSLDFTSMREHGMITALNRRTRVSEEIRLIKRRLMRRMTVTRTEASPENRRGRDHVILVTSAKPGDGKSFMAANLALSIVLDEGLNVLLIDADVARPSIGRLIGANPGAGLTDLLKDSPPALSDVLQREKKYPLSFLPAGNAVASATDLFGSQKMVALMEDIAMRYTDRIIILDAPPLLASTEPVVLAQHVGQTVFMVSAERTSRRAVETALELLDSHENVNLVLNNTVTAGQSEQFGSYYDYYQGVE